MTCECQVLPDFPCIVASLQKQTLTADFGNYLPAGVTLTGTPTVSLAATQGIDTNPTSRTVGSPSVVTPEFGTNIPATGIAQQVNDMVAGEIYLLTWSCPRSDGDTAVGYNHIPCKAPA